MKISKEDWKKLKPADKDSVMFDCIQGIFIHLKRIYVIVIAIGVVLIIEFPNWAKFLFSKAMAAF